MIGVLFNLESQITNHKLFLSDLYDCFHTHKPLIIITNINIVSDIVKNNIKVII